MFLSCSTIYQKYYEKMSLVFRENPKTVKIMAFFVQRFQIIWNLIQKYVWVTQVLAIKVFFRKQRWNKILTITHWWSPTWPLTIIFSRWYTLCKKIAKWKILPITSGSWRPLGLVFRVRIEDLGKGVRVKRFYKIIVSILGV